MFETPTLFLQPSSRAFLSALTLQFGSVLTDPEMNARTRVVAQRFLAADGPAAWKSAYADWQELSNGVSTVLKDKLQRRDAFLTGLFAAQLAYNAAILHESDSTKQQLGALLT